MSRCPHPNQAAAEAPQVPLFHLEAASVHPSNFALYPCSYPVVDSIHWAYWIALNKPLDMDSAEEVDQNVSPDVHARLMNLHIGNIVQVNPDIKKYYKEANAEYDTKDEPWASKPELPSSDEILGTDLPENDEDCVELMPNRIKEPWPSKGSYLRAHYELLREDAVAPLRDAVAYVRDDPRMMDSKDVSIYEKVRQLSLDREI